MTHITRHWVVAVALWAVAVGSTAVHAQDFPSKPVRILTPFPVGSGPEGLLRLVADKLSRTWGQPVVVENKPGGNGFIAIDTFKRGAIDGHDLILLDGVHLSAYPHLFKKLPYDAKVDFEPLLPLFKTYFFVTVATGSHYQTVAELIADAKAHPGKLNYGSWSVGNPVHLGSALFESITGTQMQHVVYKETNMLYAGVANGELSFALGTNATAGAMYRASKLRYLAVAAPKRVGAFPHVPTVGESGGPAGFEVSGWTAVVAPSGVPKAVADKIQRDVQKALAEPDVKEKLASFAYEPFVLSRPQFNAYIQTESTRFAAIVKKAQVTLD
ncbi:MAG: TctC [Burkholderiales bacterium 35-55-47]|jgi:tripartite-type tricarboxylate transporter receptor subunit TctC|uniref:Bug family tripartite tricarboxylate transporter substrate binding protein n=1 Tax=Limnohabitans sp. TaxID=1907725 RepID=UPI000BD79D64|nr:tripartite tricarboxylate transporter substrate binding protein [Limnohabitans sp.]OYY18241.1 MAG: TctC [Burkholderiales bacterium 35-55-47]OYZ72654.1 MAG: TctC [Burkholderiales bacterium 24-55-52]OZB00109.1 MAG: TctC [Burkholderiales bacterium 39-55-53]HQR86944.1 tripartite tricarboxylate transporter substrate binding protein [Limnohabitans sp.]HQS26958.1 tripartite tricarboxylate transporter substrate binding protein [Limnohabitans sp.]